MDFNQQILAGLEKIRDDLNNNAFNADQQFGGICSNLICHMSFGNFKSPMPELYDAFSVWPEFSGRLAFPVEGTSWQYFKYDSKWHPDNPYSGKRIRLLNWLIEHFKEKVNAEHHPAGR